MTDSAASLPETWSAERLMGKQVSFKGLPPAEGENGAAAASASASKPLEPPASPRKRKGKVEIGKIDPMLWGRPGHLSEEECEIFVSANIFVWYRERTNE